MLHITKFAALIQSGSTVFFLGGGWFGNAPLHPSRATTAGSWLILFTYFYQSIWIHDLDTSPPEVSSCPTQTSTLSTSNLPFQLFWSEPIFTDNVNVTKVVADNVPGIYAYSWGTTIITYTAYDAANNSATCVITIDIIDQSNLFII